VDAEQQCGKVLAFAHNSHLQRGKASWPWFTFWPVGSHLAEMFGSSYAVIGSAVGVYEDNGISPPEAGALESKLAVLPGTAVLIPTLRDPGLPAAE